MLADPLDGQVRNSALKWLINMSPKVAVVQLQLATIIGEFFVATIHAAFVALCPRARASSPQVNIKVYMQQDQD